MLEYAARVALFLKQKKGQLQKRKQRKILERKQYTKETAVIDTVQAVKRVIPFIRGIRTISRGLNMMKALGNI